MKRIVQITATIICFILVISIAIVLTGCGSKSSGSTKYHCPMHPTYISDRPGDCPICNMKLVPMDSQEETEPSKEPASPSKQSKAGPARYHCPMHPTYVSDKPGDCPICNMKLVPMEEKAETSSTGEKYICTMCPEVQSDKPGRCPECGMDLVKADGEIAGATGEQAASQPAGERKILFYRNPMDPNITSPVPAKDDMGMDFIPVYADEAAPKIGPVEGLAAISLTSMKSELAGIQTATASWEHMTRSIRTVGLVTADETRIRHIHTKIPGWIEKLEANFTGQQVRKGKPILTIYSPELLSSQEEFLRAREAAAKFEKSSLPEVRRGGEDLLAAARKRLELFDVPENFIRDLERTGQPKRTVSLLAPVSGYITSKETFEGQQVEPGMELFTVTDLSQVWVEADVYEYEAPSVKIGQKAVLTLPYDASVLLTGRVDYIYPYLSPESRTLKVRLQFNNPDLTLKPSMFVNVELKVDSGEGVVIPESSIMDTGARQVVFVDAGEGHILPREVRVGERGEGKARILEGLKDGERVVIRANFLLDSESRLRAAIEGMTAAAPSAPTGHQHD